MINGSPRSLKGHDTTRVHTILSTTSSTMSSHYSSSSYEPLSPPWSHGGSPAPTYTQPRAPVMPYRTLPAVDPMPPSYAHYTPPSSHHGLITPPPSSDGGAIPLLSASTTLVRYDLVMEPRSTLRMSSAATRPFPANHPASISGISTINVECEVPGLAIHIRSASNAHGVTCADLFNQLYDFFHRPLSREEWARVPEPLRGAMRVARGSRSRKLGLPQEDVTRMVDYLQGRTIFQRFILHRGGQSSTPTWLLQTSR